jgi:anti-anti-sigma factor
MRTPTGRIDFREVSLVQVFKLAERDFQPGCRKIDVEGELDLAVTDQLQQAIDRAAGEQAQLILIDLENCGFIDSAGIAVILRAHGEMAKRGCRVIVCSPSSRVLRVLSMTGLTDDGLVFESVDEALLTADGA